MAETRTDLVVNARAKGFQQVQQQAGKLVDAATKAAANQAKGYSKMEGSTRAYRKEIKALEKQLADLSKQQLSTMKAMQGMDKVSGVYKQLKENLKNLGIEASRTNQQIAVTKQAFGPSGYMGQPLTARQMARGGFAQGMAQGGLGIPLQRGPGMWQQAAGMATGRVLRAGIGAPFGGVQGLQQFLSSIPGIGGLASGQMANAMQFAAGSMGLQQTRLGALPLFGPGAGGLSRGIAGARQRGIAGVSPGQFYAPGRTSFASSAEITAGAQKAAAQTQTMGGQKELVASHEMSLMSAMGGGGTMGGGMGMAAIARRAARQQIKEQLPRLTKVEADRVYQEAVAKGEAPEKAFRAAQASAGAGAAAAARSRPFAEVRRLGARLGGLSEQQAIDAMSPILQRGGGGIGEAQRQGMVKAGFAAQTAYGIGPEVSGAFLQAGRRGGVVGAEGRGGEAMVDAIGQGLSLGLEGSELQDYMAQMANDIASWKQTGLPINTKSIQQMSAAVAGTGLGGIRGAAIGQGLAQAGQRLAGAGVQDTVDLLMLQTMGGFKGGGMEEYEKAQVRLEQMGGAGGWDEGIVKSLVGQLTSAGGGGASGRQVLQQAFGRKGIQMSKGETMAFEKAMLRPEEMTPEERKQAAAIRGQMGMGAAAAPKGVGGLTGQAEDVMGAYGSAIRKAADLQNQQNTVGAKMIPAMLALQTAALNVNTAFVNLAKNPIEALSSGFESLTNGLKLLTESSDKASESLGKVAF